LSIPCFFAQVDHELRPGTYRYDEMDSKVFAGSSICQTTAQIALVLTLEMMPTPTISLAVINLMQTLKKEKDDSPGNCAPRTALLKRLEDVATKEWLA